MSSINVAAIILGIMITVASKLLRRFQKITDTYS